MLETLGIAVAEIRSARRLVRTWLFAGLALATYLSVEHVTGGAPACGVAGGCADVTGSEYAVLLGVPVAFIGVVGETRTSASSRARSMSRAISRR